MALSLHTDEKKLDQMEERAYKRREDAPEIGQKSLAYQAEETKKRFQSNIKEFSSVHISGAARVNGRLLRNALISAMKNMVQL